MDLALNNQQRLICHKTQQSKLNQTEILLLIILKYVQQKMKATFMSKIYVRDLAQW